MDGTLSKEKSDVCNEIKSIEKWQNSHVGGFVEDQVFTGLIENLTDQTGIISFFIGSKLTKAQFSLNSVVVDNLQLTRQVSLLSILRLGMCVTFSVKYSKCKEDINFKAVVVEVEGPLTYRSLPVEEIKYVHNKVFYGKIKMLYRSSGTIVFELNNRTETAVFYKNCVYISDRKIKGKESTLVVGMPVCLMVVCYSGVSGCSFMATVVRTEPETELNFNSSIEEEILLHHCVFYGTIKTLTEKSGTASFWGNNMEKEVTFSRNCVLVNNLKLVKNLSLLKVLEVGMPVAFMVDCHRKNSCSFVARSIEVLQEVNLTESHAGVMATILTLTALAGTLTFLENGREKVAVFFRQSVVIKGEKINKSASLLTVLKVGWSVLIDVVQFKGKNYDFIATAVEVQELENDVAVCTPIIDNFENVPVEDFGGIIKKVSDGAGIVEFHIDNREERAVFFKKNVVVNGKKLSNHDSLLTLFYISMPVSMKITRRTKKGFNFQAVSIDFLHKDSLYESQSANINCNNIRYCGSVESLTKTVGKITFCVNGVEERAIMFNKALIVNDVKITKGTSLLSLLRVGMPVTFKAVDYIDTYCNCTFRVTHLETKLWKNSTQGRKLNGIIESLTEFSGSILFQMNSEQRKAIFSKENVYLEGKMIESEVSLSSLLEVGMPVSFKITNCDVSEENVFEVDSILIEAKSLVRSQDSDMYHGIIHRLTDTSGKILFQINGVKERAVFYKNSVRICDMKVNPGVSLLTLLKVGMQVLLMVEECKENKRRHFKATLVEVQNITECPSRSITSNFFDDQLFHGIVQKMKESCGVIQFSVNGEMENAIFFPGSVLKIDSQSKNVSLSSVFRVGMKVLLRVKFFVGLCNCNFVATAVDKQCQDLNTNYIQGNIIAVDTESGVVAFQKGNKQRKAIFYKNTLCVNGHNIENGISLSTVLRVGMCVSMQVKKVKDKGFYFEVNEGLHGIQNVFRVSESRHISCGLGTVTEILSSTTAQLQFELDGQHFGRFNLSDFFVDGQRQDNFQEISEYIKKGDVFFFDATKRNNNDCYLITCVWQGKKPGLLTRLEPYRVLIEDCKKVPCSFTGNVIALFPPHAAITETNFYGAVLLFISSLRREDQQLTEKDWIQDYLSVGDELTLEVGKKDKLFGFPLAKCAWKSRSNCLMSQESKPSCTIDSQPVIMRIETQDPCTSSPTYNKEPTSSVHNDACSPCSSTSLASKYDIATQVVCGVISSVAFYTGTVEIEVHNKKELLVFTKKELVNKENLTDDFFLSSVLEVGMPVSVTLMSCSENEDCTFKVIFVQVAEPLPNINKMAS